MPSIPYEAVNNVEGKDTDKTQSNERHVLHRRCRRSSPEEDSSCKVGYCGKVVLVLFTVVLLVLLVALNYISHHTDLLNHHSHANDTYLRPPKMWTPKIEEDGDKEEFSFARTNSSDDSSPYDQPFGDLIDDTNHEEKKEPDGRQHEQEVVLPTGAASSQTEDIIVLGQRQSCGSLRDTCMTEENHVECKKLQQTGCPTILVHAVECPFQFTCQEDNDHWEDHEEGEVQNGVALPLLPQTTIEQTSVFLGEGDSCGSPQDTCMTEKNHVECTKLQETGCSKIAVDAATCPLRFTCQEDNGHAEDEHHEAEEKNNSAVLPPLPQTTIGQAPVALGEDDSCGSPQDTCMTEENHVQCTKLQETGCSKIVVDTEECPFRFRCEGGNEREEP